MGVWSDMGKISDLLELVRAGNVAGRLEVLTVGVTHFHLEAQKTVQDKPYNVCKQATNQGLRVS